MTEFTRRHPSPTAAAPHYGYWAWQHQLESCHPSSLKSCNPKKSFLLNTITAFKIWTNLMCFIQLLWCYNWWQLIKGNKLLYLWQYTMEQEEIRNLHSSTILQEELNTFLTTITSSIVQGSVVILVKSIHSCSSFQQHLSRFYLQIDFLREVFACSPTHILQQQ